MTRAVCLTGARSRGGETQMVWFRIPAVLAVATPLAWGGTYRTWIGTADCDCIQVDGGRRDASYVAVDVCASDQPDCPQTRCRELLADAGCDAFPIQTSCKFDPGWDYCNPR